MRIYVICCHLFEPIVDVLLQAVTDALGPFIYGMQASTEHFGPAKQYLATVSLMISGTRTLVCLSTTELMQYLHDKHHPAVPVGKNPDGSDVMGYTPEGLTKFALEMSLDALKDYVLTGRAIIHGTVPANEIMYLPAGWILLEQVMQENCMGIKFVSLVHPASDKSAAATFANIIAAYDGGVKNLAFAKAIDAFYAELASPSVPGGVEQQPSANGPANAVDLARKVE